MILRSRRTVRSGFTLIELVVVLVILAAIASLVIPKLGFIKDQADSATGAAGAAQVASNLETYHMTVGAYPLGLDTLTTGSTLYTKLWSHPGSPGFGLGADLTAADFPTDSGSVESFGHAFKPALDGKVYFYDHDTTATDPSNSATVVRNGYSMTGKVAQVTGTGLIQSAGYPSGTVPTGTMLVAFGIGPNSALVGTTMASAPRNSAQDATKYGRYVAIFAVYTSGKTADLKTVVDSFGNSIDDNVTNYKNASPTRGSAAPAAATTP